LRPQGDAATDWKLLEQVKSWAGVPLVLKGILHPAEAGEAVDRGADGIVVSNHGGRSTDGLPATIEQLPKIAATVQQRVPLLIDGGFRRGSDILKALALGADAVLLGRPVLWALAAYGAAGVQRLFEILQHETALAMGLAGQPSVAAAGPDLVKIHKR
jgi:4-hydroxymandelate oxidase